jgi:pimeloyl-ACP methyl ester carboxylesterase
VLMTTAADGVGVQARDEGRGPVVLVVHAGRDDGTAWGKVADLLSARFRVVRLHRRRYRLAVPSAATCAIADEVGDVHAIAQVLGGPVLLVGHSSGAVVALEALLTCATPFAGAVLYEPPAVVGPPLGGAALVRARAALDAGRPGRSLAIFLRDVVHAPPWVVPIVRAKVALNANHRARVAPQIGDCEAVERLGNRLGAYADITVPVLLFGGERSPAHFGARMDALARVIPHAERQVLRGQGHFANDRAPATVARLIASFADRVLFR